MGRATSAIVALSLAIGVIVAGCGGDPVTTSQPVEVEPADDGTSVADLVRGPADAKPPTRPGAGDGGGLWVVDANGEPVGVLVRRGSDDKISAATIYDRVQVFHPNSGLFFELTMADAKVRFPAKVYFKGSGCTEPVGVAVGSCTDCRSGFGIGLLHGGQWWRVVEGVNWEVLPNSASIDSGVASGCVAHSSSSTKGFPVSKVSGTAPGIAFAPPLRFEWR